MLIRAIRVRGIYFRKCVSDSERENCMNDHKSTIRYIGYRSLPDGGRGFDFSFALGYAKATMVTIDAPISFFRGPGHIAIQEAASICYETLKFRAQTNETIPPERFDLTPADVAQHRRAGKDSAKRR
jgi:hypothetical protein